MYQDVGSYPGIPESTTVGVSGIEAMRLARSVFLKGRERPEAVVRRLPDLLQGRLLRQSIY